MARTAVILVAIGVALATGPAVAQFGNIFGSAPPRPPADIPNGPFPQQPPPLQSPQPGAAANQAVPQQSVIESQPLPEPGGSPPPAPAQNYPPRQLPPPQQRAVTPPIRTQPAPQRAVTAPAATQPAPANAAPAAEAPPPDDTIVEAPTPHIDNRRAVFAGLDKITGRTISFDVGIGETVQFGALQVTPRACYTRPPTEATNTDAFVEVDELTLQHKLKRIFTGWMFASSPGLNAVEHPIYDVWLAGCESPVETKLAEPAVLPAPAVSHTRRPVRQHR